MTRIYGTKVNIDESAVHRFFEARAQSMNAAHPLTSVMYQDQNPELAEMRDALEKQRVLPLLNLGLKVRVLDVGCGIGRWADALVGRVERYHGVDFSASLIAAAQHRCTSPALSFQVLAAQNVQPSTLQPACSFDLIMISGVLIYLNDEDLSRTLHSLNECCATTSQIYIREPVGVRERLTLSDFESTDLNSSYSAIYRTEQELLDFFSESLLAFGFHLTINDCLYPDALNNRSETTQRIFIFQRS